MTPWLTRASHLVVVVVAAMLTTSVEARSDDDDSDSVLTRRAAALAPSEGVDIEVRLIDGRVYEWDVRADASLLRALVGDDAEAPEREAAVCAWIERTHERLLDLTKAYVAETVRDPSFNPATDVRADYRCVDPLVTVIAEFIGPRCVRGPNAAAPVTVTADTADLMVEVVPDRYRWRPRETITGVVRYRNVSDARLPLPFWLFRHGGTTVTDVDGGAPESFMMRGHISWATPESYHRFLAPGASIKTQFEEHTDRLAHLVSGSILPVGRWVVTHRDLIDSCNIRTHIVPALIEVAADPGTYAGPRIIRVRAAGPNLCLTREDGRLHFVDPESGAPIGSIDALNRESFLMPYWSSTPGVIGREGRLVEIVVEHPHVRIRIAEPSGTSTTVTFEADEFQGDGVPRPLRYGDDGQLVVATRRHLHRIDLATGAIVERIRTRMQWPEVSGDAAFVASSTELGNPSVMITISERADPTVVRDVSISGLSDRLDVRFGVSAIYVLDALTPGVRVLPYESNVPHLLDTGPVSYGAESADGQWLAVFAPGRTGHERNPGPVTIEVWNLTTRAKAYEIALESDADVFFVSDPLRLVCIPRMHLAWTESWYTERAIVYDGATGARLGATDLTPLPIMETPAP